MQQEYPTPSSHNDVDPNTVTLDSDTYGTPEQKAKTILEGAARGVAGPIPDFVSKNLGIAKEEDILGRMKTNPILSGTSEAAGLVGGMFTGTGEGALIEHAGQAMTGLTEAGRAAQTAAATAKALGLTGEEAAKTISLMTQEVPLLSKVGASTLKGATEMAIMSGSDEISKEVLNDPDTSATSAWTNIGLNAALGGLTGGVLTGAISPLWKATTGPLLDRAVSSVVNDITGKLESGTTDPMLRPVFKKLASTLMGVSEEDIDGYLKYHADVLKAPEFEDVYQHTLDHVGKLNDEVAAGQMSVAEAQKAFEAQKQTMEQTFRERGASAQEAASFAKYALKDAQTKLATDLEQNAMDAAKHVTGSMESLRQKVIDGSSNAYKVLDDAKFAMGDAKNGIKLQGLTDKVEEMAKALESQTTPEATAQAAKLREYAENVMTQHPTGVVSGPQAKSMIQGLDSISKWNYGASNFENGLSGQYKQLRFHLDDILKRAVPEYKAAMKPVAEDTGLLAKLSKYGEEASAIRGVRGLKNPANYKIEKPLLEQLEKSVKTKFLHDIEPYANPEMTEKLKKMLPEFEEAQKTASDLHTLKDPATKAAMVEAINNSPERQAVEQAQAGLEKAKVARAELKGVTEANLQSALKTVGKSGKNIAKEEVLSKIPALNGKTVPEIMNLLRLKEAFEKNATRGSKHVNLFGGLMSGLFSAMRFGGMEGFGVGALAGAGVDNFGPQMVRGALDKYMEHFGNLSEMSSEGKLGAAKKMLGHILGAPVPASGEGFKAGTDFIAAQMKGDAALRSAVKGMMVPGARVLTESELTKIASQRDSTDKRLDKFDSNNGHMVAQNSDALNHYMAPHAAAAQKLVANQVNYLKSIKPRAYKPGPLDAEIEPSADQVDRYNNAKDIANNPLVVLQKVKDGTIQITDMQDLMGLAPALQPKVSKLIMEEIAKNTGKNESIPYETRMGMSLFMGTPLDATMQPQNIIAAQPQPKPMPQQQPPGKTKRGTSSLGKNNKTYMTNSQSAESDRQGRD
jgi:hypothetical protein